MTTYDNRDAPPLPPIIDGKRVKCPGCKGILSQKTPARCPDCLQRIETEDETKKARAT